ncbi:hypothetical protein PGTUg99_021702 [Puccinia graminis f. sp. tritici]|uniref:Uncharacterized protein n=1 Tax=Puccinia graminis f. sp. tritici TaxID=56615 RepID=A0A5B0RF01_PUCGR|nr:hypothetical protein PGTUg99_021702 [Puccinia graminis f. sp. tritici]
MPGPIGNDVAIMPNKFPRCWSTLQDCDYINIQNFCDKWSQELTEQPSAMKSSLNISLDPGALHPALAYHPLPALGNTSS